MRHSRRRFVQLAGGALSAGALADGIETATAAEKPPMTWEPAHYSNYTSASRTPSDVRWIVMHTIEGPASAGINWFKNPDADVSSHFVVDSDGSITKMVGIDDVAWTQGNGEYNDTAISIEMAGYANQTDFSAAMYEATGQLVAYLCEEYGIPTQHPTFDVAPCSAYDGEGGVVGHDQIPSPYDCSEVTGGKVDPGSTWNWDYFMEKVGGSSGGGGGSIAAGDAVATTAAVNVRTDPGIGDNVRHTNPEGVRGVVKSGPQTADGYTWWKVGYENGMVGWSVATYLGDASTAFLADQRVETTADLVVHDDHALSAPDVWTAPEGSGGYVRAGPQTADGYTWWQVAFNSGETGWSVQKYLTGAPVAGHGVGHASDDGGDGGDDGGDGGSDPAFADGDTVEATTALNTRRQPGTGEELVATVADGAAAEVVNGPVDADGYTWWGLHWQEKNVWGWSVERYLTASDRGGGESGGDPLPFDVETDVTDPVAVTGQDIDDAIAAEIPDSPLIGLGDTFLAVQDAYSVNALYQAAHAIHESAWGTSTIAQDKRNLFGWGAADSDPYGGAKRFDSFEDCVWYVMDQVKTRYLTPGDWRYNGPTLDGMNVYYASDDRWDVKIAGHYRTIAANL